MEVSERETRAHERRELDSDFRNPRMWSRISWMGRRWDVSDKVAMLAMRMKSKRQIGRLGGE